MTSPRKPAGFVHLRVKSAYSLLEGAIRPSQLAKLALENAMPAVAVTDVNNLFGVYEISEILAKAGVQPIVGCLLAVDFDPPQLGGAMVRQRPPMLPLLVKDDTGYGNLTKLLSAAYLGVEPGDWPHVTPEALAKHAGGLIALTGGPGGPLNRLIVENQADAAEMLLDRLSAMFGNRLYVEVQRHGLPEERAAEGKLIDVAYARRLPLVATNDVHFGAADMYEAHDALLCIAEGTFVSQQDRKRLTREHRFKTAEEMAVQFADLPEAIENTIEIAKRCAFRPKKRAPILPKFVPESGRTPAEELRVQAEEGLTRRLAAHGLHADGQVYRDRLQYELDVIIGMDFPGYFLIVSDFMKWTRAHGIPVGVRGSGATSLVAWSLDITNLDPIRFGLLFERFLNPERISISIFARSAATKSSAMCSRNTARTAWRTSSRWVRCRRAPPCAMSAACCRCRWGWSTRSPSSSQIRPGATSRSMTPSRASRGCKRFASRNRPPSSCSRSCRRSKASTATPPRIPPAW